MRESAEVDLLACFDEYSYSGMDVVWLTTELCIQMKLGHEQLLSAR